MAIDAVFGVGDSFSSNPFDNRMGTRQVKNQIEPARAVPSLPCQLAALSRDGGGDVLFVRRREPFLTLV